MIDDQLNDGVTNKEGRVGIDGDTDVRHDSLQGDPGYVIMSDVATSSIWFGLCNRKLCFLTDYRSSSKGIYSKAPHCQYKFIVDGNVVLEL